jgi:hypothetical protein
MAAVRNAAENRVTWLLLIDDAEHWHWKKAHPTGTVERSQRAFGSLDECAQDGTNMVTAPGRVMNVVTCPDATTRSQR